MAIRKLKARDIERLENSSVIGVVQAVATGGGDINLLDCAASCTCSCTGTCGCTCNISLTVLGNVRCAVDKTVATVVTAVEGQ